MGQCCTHQACWWPEMQTPTSARCFSRLHTGSVCRHCATVWGIVVASGDTSLWLHSSGHRPAGETDRCLRRSQASWTVLILQKLNIGASHAEITQARTAMSPVGPRAHT